MGGKEESGKKKGMPCEEGGEGGREGVTGGLLSSGLWTSLPGWEGGGDQPGAND